MKELYKDNSQEQRDSVELLYNNTFAGLIANLITSFALVFSFNSESIQTQKYFWLVLLMVTVIIRGLNVIHWQNNFDKSTYNCRAALFRFNIGINVTAALWCSYIFLIAGKTEVTELATSLIVLSAMGGGGAAVLAGSRYAAMSYSIIALVPSSIYLLFFIDSSTELFGYLGLVFTVMMVMTSQKAAKFTQNAIRLKNHNRLLVTEMEAEVLKRTDDIYKLSNLDPLTKLYNRSSFSKTLTEILSESENTAENTAVLFIDLDGFKQVNDAFGHEVGDKVLKIVTSRLVEFKLNGHIGRWGGDEFVIAMPHFSEKEAVDLGVLIIEAISAPIQVDSVQVNIGASIGISLSPSHSSLEQELIQFADIAMYKSKKSDETLPRVFCSELYLELREEEALREGLRNAVERDEFFSVYQPIFDASSGDIVSCEALVRWSFNGKLVPPSIFIEICEQTGLIIDIGKQILKQACHDAMQWSASGNGSHIKVSVNVSILQLLEPFFIDFIDETLQSSNLPPERLILEITESIFAKNQTLVKQCVEEIKSRNIMVSIDDFGTGYSSMSQLQSLPFDIIKIDRSFVTSLQNKGEAIINATQHLAKELKCKTVVEGIETQDQADKLNSMGVDYMQGFLLAKPMKQEEMISILQGASTPTFAECE